MPAMGCGGKGRSTAIGPYATGPSVNRMLSRMRLPTPSLFIKNMPAQTLWSVGPFTIDSPTAVMGVLTGTLFMVGTTVALFPSTVIACGANVIRWLCVTIQNIFNAIGLTDGLDQTLMWVFSM
ncbi:hypothetical protein [Bordetella sp. BOR01]|uniref:hypothetical protein n=1 Tax=Bordetella sp. BOR01 TaxID=2854779 RepID=UPI001C490EB2|nr:hypothetical protein [Bordetella sp. BOR01]MBV7481799.1 hypothetical protein [Bordetella sp. BOR01]